MVRFTFLSENKTDNPCCMAEHGLSIYIEAAGRKLIFDTGASPLFLQNAENLNIDLSHADAVVISHGHYDHTEGVPAFLEVNDRAQFYIHREAFQHFYGTEKGSIDKVHCGILWNSQVKEEVMKRATLTEGFAEIYKDIFVSGTIPDVEGIVPPEKFYIKKAERAKEEWVEDHFNHEQFLAIRDRNDDGTSKGIYVFSGCSHKGVIPAIHYVREKFKGEKIVVFAAGMHLYGADEAVRKKTVDSIMACEIEKIFPVHCTGIKAICDLKTAMGDNCIAATAGDTYVF